MKTKIISYLGPDCSGKDSTMHYVAKLLEYNIFSMPRSPICNIVYDTIYERQNNLRYSKNIELINNLLNLNTVFVFVYAQPNVLCNRAILRDEKHINNIDDFKKHLKIYKETFNIIKNINEEYKNKFLCIDNSKMTIEQTSKKIWKKITKIS